MKEMISTKKYQTTYKYQIISFNLQNLFQNIPTIYTVRLVENLFDEQQLFASY